MVPGEIYSVSHELANIVPLDQICVGAGLSVKRRRMLAADTSNLQIDFDLSMESDIADRADMMMYDEETKSLFSVSSLRGQHERKSCDCHEQAGLACCSKTCVSHFTNRFGLEKTKLFASSLQLVARPATQW